MFLTDIHFFRPSFPLVKSPQIINSITMSIAEHNAEPELMSAVNVGELTIAGNDGNNGGNIDDVNVAEFFGLSAEEAEEDAMAQFFNDRLSCLFTEVVLFAGVEGAGTIRCASKKSWELFGGDGLWIQLLAIRAGPPMYKSLSLSTLDAKGSKEFLKNLLTDSPAAPSTPKPLSEYSFWVEVEMRGLKFREFVEVGFLLGHRVTIRVPIDNANGAKLHACVRNDFDWGTFMCRDSVPVNISVRVVDRSSRKLATLVQATTMRAFSLDVAECYLSAEDSFGVVHDFRHVVDDPGVIARPRIPIFETTLSIHLNDIKTSFLQICFADRDGDSVFHPTQILDVMERLDWK